MGLVVGLGCVSLGGLAGLLSRPGRRMGNSWGGLSKAPCPRNEGLGILATMLLATKSRGEDLPGRRGVYKTCQTSA